MIHETKVFQGSLYCFLWRFGQPINRLLVLISTLDYNVTFYVNSGKFQKEISDLFRQILEKFCPGF